jgi:hypothetical protein
MLPSSTDFMQMLAPKLTPIEQLFAHLESEKVCRTYGFLQLEHTHDTN